MGYLVDGGRGDGKEASGVPEVPGVPLVPGGWGRGARVCGIWDTCFTCNTWQKERLQPKRFENLNTVIFAVNTTPPNKLMSVNDFRGKGIVYKAFLTLIRFCQKPQQVK